MSKQAENYYPAFDYLRIILAMTVALGHSGIVIWEHAGDLAVQIFFAISGWLIGNILLRVRPGALARFYFNRAARIWIPYYIAVILLVSASLLRDPITPKWLEFIFYDITFVYNFFGPPQLATYASAMPLAGTGNHFWSICAEEQFYLAAPLLIVIIPRLGRAISFWAVVTLAIMMSPYWNYFESISFGVLAAVLRLTHGDWQTHRVAKAALVGVGFSLFVLTYLGLMEYRFGAPILSICLVMLLAQAGVRSTLATFLGGISFPMYLNHWIGTFIANAALARFGLKNSLISHISGVIIALLIATALYVLVDRVVRENRDRYFTTSFGKFAAGFAFSLVSIGLIGGLYVTRQTSPPFVIAISRTFPN